MLSSGFLSEQVRHVRLGQADTKHKGTLKSRPCSAASHIRVGAVPRPCCTEGSAVLRLLGTLGTEPQKWESNWLVISSVQTSSLLNYSHRQEQLKLFLAALFQRASLWLRLCCFGWLCASVSLAVLPREFAVLCPRAVWNPPLMDSDGQLAFGRT